jgi:hypothetical protein
MVSWLGPRGCQVCKLPSAWWPWRFLAPLPPAARAALTWTDSGCSLVPPFQFLPLRWACVILAACWQPVFCEFQAGDRLSAPAPSLLARCWQWRPVPTTAPLGFDWGPSQRSPAGSMASPQALAAVRGLEAEFRQLAQEARSKEGLAGFFSSAADQAAVKDASERLILKFRGFADLPDALDQMKTHYQVRRGAQKAGEGSGCPLHAPAPPPPATRRQHPPAVCTPGLPCPANLAGGAQAPAAEPGDQE